MWFDIWSFDVGIVACLLAILIGVGLALLKEKIT